MYSWALRKCIAYTNNFRGHKESTSLSKYVKVAWPSGLRRWFKAPVSSGAWVRIPPLPDILPINFVQVPNSSTYFIEKWPFLEGSCQNF